MEQTVPFINHKSVLSQNDKKLVWDDTDLVLTLLTLDTDDTSDSGSESHKKKERRTDLILQNAPIIL